MPLVVRKIKQEDDFKKIGEIYPLSWKVGYKGIVPQKFLNELTSKAWVASLQRGDYDVYVLLLDDEYIGVSAICPAREESMKGWGEIVSMYMLPEFFGKGYAEKLFSATKNALLEKGYKNIYLWTLKENARARCFYEKQGFTLAGDDTDIEIGGKVLKEIKYTYNADS